MNTLEKEFIPYEQALALKELGFDEPCFRSYDKSGNLVRAVWQEIECSTPTFSQAFRWFREKYNWQHSIDPTSDQHSFELGYNYWIWNYKTGEEYHTMPKNRPTGDWEFETYEEAELACLNKLIEIVKESNQ